MELLTWSVVFIISLFVLIKASDFFTESAEKIGLHFGVPAFIVGVTIVAFGTSLPEIITSIISVLKDSSEIVVGNVVGSNIANIFLVFGLTAIIARKMTIAHDIIKVDLPFLAGSALLLAASIWDGEFNRFEAVLCLAGLGIYLLYSINSKDKHEDEELEKEKKQFPWKAGVMLVISGGFIYLGASFTIEAIIRLSDLLNLGKEVIAVSAVAFGTSLPELVVTISAVRKNKPELAVGNVLGSNIFNAFAVMGIPALIGPLAIPASIITFSLPMMLIATVLFILMMQDRKIANWEGWLLLLFYVFFIVRLFGIF
jgi:cation:H+ antiporter